MNPNTGVLPLYSINQAVLGERALAGGLEQTISRGPFQPYHSLKTKKFSIYLFCSSSLASNSKSSGLSCVGEDGDNAGVDRVVEEDVVCNEADGLAT